MYPPNRSLRRKALALFHLTDGGTEAQQFRIPNAIYLGNGRVGIPTRISVTPTFLLFTGGPPPQPQPIRVTLM